MGVTLTEHGGRGVTFDPGGAGPEIPGWLLQRPLRPHPRLQRLCGQPGARDCGSEVRGTGWQGLRAGSEGHRHGGGLWAGSEGHWQGVAGRE